MTWFKEAAWTPCYGLVNDNGERLYYTDSSKTATTTEIKDIPLFSSASTNSNGVPNVPITPETEGFKIILPSLHEDEISSEAIANAESKGWTIEFVDNSVVDYTY